MANTPKEEANRDVANYLCLPNNDVSSASSHRSESGYAFKDAIDENYARKIYKAEKYVNTSSKLNQLITLLLTKVLKECRRLQHLDLTSTNLPS